MPSNEAATTGSDAPRPVAASHDQSRPVATDATQYTLTIEDALLRYEHAGYPRTPRSVQRYCAKGHLDCLRQETTYGDKFMITEQSVARHIAQIAELASATSRDLSRQDATGKTPDNAEPLPAADRPVSSDNTQRPVATSHDLSRQDATGRDGVAATVATTPATDDRYVKQLENENEFLRDQVRRKDTQIGELTERAKETNILIQSLHHLVLRLTPGRSEPTRPAEQYGDQPGTTQTV